MSCVPRGALGSPPVGRRDAGGGYREAERFLCPECMSRLHPSSGHPSRDGGAGACPDRALSSPPK